MGIPETQIDGLSQFIIVYHGISKFGDSLYTNYTKQNIVYHGLEIKCVYIYIFFLKNGHWSVVSHQPLLA